MASRPIEVTLLNRQNDAVTVYLDQNTHLPLKTSFTWRDPKDKQKNVEEEIFDNYRLVQGIMTPYSITRYLQWRDVAPALHQHGASTTCRCLSPRLRPTSTTTRGAPEKAVKSSQIHGTVGLEPQDPLPNIHLSPEQVSDILDWIGHGLWLFCHVQNSALDGKL